MDIRVNDFRISFLTTFFSAVFFFRSSIEGKGCMWEEPFAREYLAGLQELFFDEYGLVYGMRRECMKLFAIYSQLFIIRSQSYHVHLQIAYLIYISRQVFSFLSEFISIDRRFCDYRVLYSWRTEPNRSEASEWNEFSSWLRSALMKYLEKYALG